MERASTVAILIIEVDAPSFHVSSADGDDIVVLLGPVLLEAPRLVKSRGRHEYVDRRSVPDDDGMDVLAGYAVVVGPITDVEVANSSYGGMMPVVDVNSHVFAYPALRMFRGWTKSFL